MNEVFVIIESWYDEDHGIFTRSIADDPTTGMPAFYVGMLQAERVAASLNEAEQKKVSDELDADSNARVARGEKPIPQHSRQAWLSFCTRYQVQALSKGTA